MRVLLLSDTHGSLSTIDGLARMTCADAVVHAGDFGFYDRESTTRLSTRELMLSVLHSELPDEVKKRAHRMDRTELTHFVETQAPLSELPDYLEGKRSFSLPVFAVWGNHEDRAVVEMFLSGTHEVENLQLLVPRASCRVGPFRLFGLGGNVLAGRKLFDRDIGGGGGKVWATLSQVGDLLEAAKSEVAEPGEVRVLVSHVSPGKEPLVGRLGVFLGAHFLVSGHMGTPYCSVWNEFAIREVPDAEAWLDRDTDRVLQAWEKASCRVKDPNERRRVECGLTLLADLPGELIKRARGRAEPPWYRDGFCVNLPDAAQGHALLVHEDGRVALETYSTGKRFP